MRSQARKRALDKNSLAVRQLYLLILARRIVIELARITVHSSIKLLSQEQFQLLFGYRWVVLQQFLHCFADVLFFFFWLGFGIQSLGRNTAPYKLLGGRVIHTEVQLPGVHRRCRAVSRGCAHPATSVPPAAPARAVAPTGVIRSELFFGADRRLIANIKVSVVVIRFRKAFCSQLGIDS